MNTTRIALGAAIIALVSTSAAIAAPGYATGAVNVRTGPGTGYSKVGTLAAGEVVDVKQCQGSWCFVDRNAGTDGWVSKNYLAAYAGGGGGGGGGSSAPDIPFNFGVTVGPGGPSFSFGIGDAPPPPPAPPVPARACFYKSNNYTGAHFCAPVGTNDSGLVGGWNDSISSIRLEGGAKVTVCQHNFYGGACTTYTSNRPSLGFYNNIISSYQVF